MPIVKKYKNPPPEIAKLVAKFSGNRSKAARAIGLSDSGKLNALGHRKVEMTDDIKARIGAALRGEHVPEAITKDRRSAKPAGALIGVVAKAAIFEKLYNLGEGLGGVWKFKRHIGKEWIGFIAMAEADAQDFKVLAERRRAEIFPV